MPILFFLYLVRDNRSILKFLLHLMDNKISKSLVVLSQVISRFVFIAFIDFRPQETKPDPKLIK